MTQKPNSKLMIHGRLAAPAYRRQAQTMKISPYPPFLKGLRGDLKTIFWAIMASEFDHLNLGFDIRISDLEF
jgi:hypothetical protein